MAGDRTFVDLYKAEVIIEADLGAAVEAYMPHPKTSRFGFASRSGLDVMVAVRTRASARKPMNDPVSGDASKRVGVRRAIPLAKPVKG